MCICTPNLGVNDNDSVGWAFECLEFLDHRSRSKKCSSQRWHRKARVPLCPLDGYLRSKRNTTWDRQIFFYQSWWNADWNAVGSYFKAHFEQKHFSLFFRKLMQDVNGLIFLGQEPLASQQVPCSFLTGSLFVSYRFQLEHTLCQRLCEWHVIV